MGFEGTLFSSRDRSSLLVVLAEGLGEVGGEDVVWVVRPLWGAARTGESWSHIEFAREGLMGQARH